MNVHIEFTGPQGSGKTLMAQRVMDLLTQNGFTVQQPSDSHSALDRDALVVEAPADELVRQMGEKLSVPKVYGQIDGNFEITTTELGLPPKGTNLNNWIDEQIDTLAADIQEKYAVIAGRHFRNRIGEIARGAALMVISDHATLITNLANFIHGRNVAAGWWTDLETGEDLHGKRNMYELLALVHSEVSEALEGRRKNLPDDKLPHRPMFRVELIDAIIRLLDILGSEQNAAHEHPAGVIFMEKVGYNDVRPDHKPENRHLEHGKKV